MVVSPHTLLVELEFLRRKGVLDIENRIFIDRECVIVTPMHKLINRILETLRSKGGKYGTTGMGVGVTIDDKENKDVTSLQIADVCDEKVLYAKLKKMMMEKLKKVKEIMENFKKDQKSVYDPEFAPGDEVSEVDDAKITCEQANKFVHEFLRANTVDSLFEFYRDFGRKFNHCFIDSSALIQEYLSKGYNIIMEGAQGALLDKIHGFYPHITKSLCSAENALNLLKNTHPKDSIEVIKVGVLRVYSSRHGNGPFLSHDPIWGNLIPEEHNSGSGWQGDFRIGPFDLVAARYGLDIFQPDVLSLTCLDKLLVAAEGNMEIGRFPVIFGYRNKKNKDRNEDLFIYDKKKEIVERLVKRKEEEAWKNLDLVKTMGNLQGVKGFVGELEGVDYEAKVREVVEKESRRKFKKIEEEKLEKMGKFIALIEKKLGVPVKILSFGASVHDKVYID